MNLLTKREITAVKKDINGEITMLCVTCGATGLSNLGSGTNIGILSSYLSSWSPRKKIDVIDDIENKGITYIVKSPGVLSLKQEVEVEVISIPAHGKYLRTKPDSTQKNNLDYLPPCQHP